MNTIELLRCSLEVAEALGYGVRQEWLAGAAGGRCEIGGKKWLFVDLSLTACEQLEQVTDALGEDPAIHTLTLPAPLQPYFGIRKSA